jgi:hypothetical protein
LAGLAHPEVLNSRHLRFEILSLEPKRWPTPKISDLAPMEVLLTMFLDHREEFCNAKHCASTGLAVGGKELKGREELCRSC